jgi:hypothetical protein
VKVRHAALIIGPDRGRNEGVTALAAPPPATRGPVRRRRWWRAARGALVVVLLFLLVDELTGLAYKTGTAAGLRVTPARSGPTRRALVVAPGHSMSGDVLSRSFAPHLPARDALLAVRYAERGVDLDAIYAQVRRELDGLKPESVRFYGVSMGGLVAAGLVQRYHADGDPYGRAELVFDTAPAGPDDIRRPDWVLAGGCYYRGGALSGLLWAAGLVIGDRILPQPTPEPDADPQVIRDGRNATRFIGAPSVTSQGCFIHHQPRAGAGMPPDAAASVSYLTATDPQEDPTVNVPQAIRHWRAIFPALRVVTLPARRGAWHGSTVERPREIMDVLAADG